MMGCYQTTENSFKAKNFWITKHEDLIETFEENRHSARKSIPIKNTFVRKEDFYRKGISIPRSNTENKELPSYRALGNSRSASGPKKHKRCPLVRSATSRSVPSLAEFHKLAENLSFLDFKSFKNEVKPVKRPDTPGEQPAEKIKKDIVRVGDILTLVKDVSVKMEMEKGCMPNSRPPFEKQLVSKSLSSPSYPYESAVLQTGGRCYNDWRGCMSPTPVKLWSAQKRAVTAWPLKTTEERPSRRVNTAQDVKVSSFPVLLEETSKQEISPVRIPSSEVMTVPGKDSLSSFILTDSENHENLLHPSDSSQLSSVSEVKKNVTSIINAPEEETDKPFVSDLNKNQCCDKQENHSEKIAQDIKDQNTPGEAQCSANTDRQWDSCAVLDELLPECNSKAEPSDPSVNNSKDNTAAFLFKNGENEEETSLDRVLKGHEHTKPHVDQSNREYSHGPHDLLKVKKVSHAVKVHNMKLQKLSLLNTEKELCHWITCRQEQEDAQRKDNNVEVTSYNDENKSECLKHNTAREISSIWNTQPGKLADAHFQAKDQESPMKSVHLEKEDSSNVNIHAMFRESTTPDFLLDFMEENRPLQLETNTKASHFYRTWKSHRKQLSSVYNRKQSSELKEWVRTLKEKKALQDAHRLDRRLKKQKVIYQSNQKIDERLRRVGPHLEIYEAFHPVKTGSSSHQFLQATICIQKFIRSWLVRIQYNRIKTKALNHGPSLPEAVKKYRSMMQKLQKRNDVRKPSVPLVYSEIEEWMDRKTMYEKMFSKREFWNEMDKSELPSFLKDCGHYPSKQDIENAWCLINYGTFGKAAEAVKKQQAVELAFTLYPPAAAKCLRRTLHQSTWLNPIVDGEEGYKYLVSGHPVLKEADMRIVGKLVATSIRERKERRNALSLNIEGQTGKK
ncbi:uncharacterized protein LOC120527133 [Polypterus senegalus]|uniref:uncharacterized protein LOC120527133 n=1 Tax=Polypterus senegalus TaxID=55291 RepID=UPI0019657FCD|nr:uncharacterized protein LOC120527133 [Polypterus senegalus]